MMASAFVQFSGHIPRAQRDLIERLISEHFPHSLGAVEVEIRHSLGSEPGRGYAVVKATLLALNAKVYSSLEPEVLLPPYFEEDVSVEVNDLLEEHRAYLAHLDRTSGNRGMMLLDAGEPEHPRTRPRNQTPVS